MSVIPNHLICCPLQSVVFCIYYPLNKFKIIKASRMGNMVACLSESKTISVMSYITGLCWKCFQKFQIDVNILTGLCLPRMTETQVSLFPLESSIFWDVKPCSPLKVSRRFGRLCHLHIQDWRVRQGRSIASDACCALQPGFLLGLLFNPENWVDMCIRNVCCFSADYTALYQKDGNFITTAVRTSNSTFFVGVLESFIAYGNCNEQKPIYI
jgi:hypothetical protein